jgi:hypothetical protein
MEAAREFACRRPDLGNVPFLVLRGKGDRGQQQLNRKAYSANGEVTSLFQCRASRSFHMDQTSGMPMLQFNTLVTHYKPNVLTGRLMFSWNTSILSDVMCMPEKLKESQISFLQQIRGRSIEKQLRDRRLAVERIDGEGGAVVSLWWRTMGNWGSTPLYPELDPCDGTDPEGEMGREGLAMEIER